MKDLHSKDLGNSQKNVQILQDRLLKELCSRDYHSKRLGNAPIFDIDDIYKKSFNDIEKKYFLRFLTWFAEDSEYIQFLFENKIALTFIGRNYCVISQQYK
ncbi:MAG TPA: hypothetical protein VFM28_04090 [Nitrososphaeraceae archaeon]|jgi:hypothetical protein|nr:hypothetical protein [Nitrososphaeraceae archaeon]